MTTHKKQEEIIHVCINCGKEATHVRRYAHKMEWLYFCKDCRDTGDMPIKQ